MHHVAASEHSANGQGGFTSRPNITSVGARYPSIFPWPPVETILYLLNLFVTYLAKVCTLWEIIAHQTLRDLPYIARRSITFDRGTEFVSWPHLQTEIGTQTWFYDPSSLWQKGTVENTNRRVRRWLPRERHHGSLPLSSFASKRLPGKGSRIENDLRAPQRDTQKMPWVEDTR